MNKLCVWVLSGALLVPAGAQAGDPMKPPGWMSAAPLHTEAQEPLQLQQVSFRNGSGSAVINNRLLRKGDVIGNARIVDIKPGRVLIKIGQKTQELSLLTDTRQKAQ
ncbi:MAG: hypothetical protein KYX62_14315 [Pseudomonadota bacterium]|nr:hypothetical protein [Pseudomonadota bacterium]